MHTSEWIAVAGIALSLLITIIGSTAMLSYRIGTVIQRLDSMDKRVGRLDVIVEKIQETLTQIQFTIGQMRVKLEVLWQHHLSRSNSPKVLNDAGLQALEASKIGSFANDQYLQILSQVRNSEPRNAYQVHEALIDVVNQYKYEASYMNMLQEAAFASGYDIDSLLYVAALSIRDRVINDLGFQRN